MGDALPESEKALPLAEEASTEWSDSTSGVVLLTSGGREASRRDGHRDRDRTESQRRMRISEEAST